MELADLVVVNKADLDADAATRARAQITSALRLFGQHGHPEHAHHDADAVAAAGAAAERAEGSGPGCVLGSGDALSRTADGQRPSGARRQQQAQAWMWERIDAGLRAAFRQHPAVRAALPSLQQQVGDGRVMLRWRRAGCLRRWAWAPGGAGSRSGDGMTPQDLQRIRSSPGWRQHAHRAVPRHPRRQRHRQGPARRAAGRRATSCSMASRGSSGCRCCALCRLTAARARSRSRSHRLRALAAAGVPVPEVLHVETTSSCSACARRAASICCCSRAQADRGGYAACRRWWTLHAHDQYLSQAFARNFIAAGDTLAMIDFEDDPLEVMPLAQAQARDWLAYLHSSAGVPVRAHAGAQLEASRCCAPSWRASHVPVRAAAGRHGQRLRWVRRLPVGDAPRAGAATWRVSASAVAPYACRRRLRRQPGHQTTR